MEAECSLHITVLNHGQSTSGVQQRMLGVLQK